MVDTLRLEVSFRYLACLWPLGLVEMDLVWDVLASAPQ
jgi:hypothetical protein